ncbi:MULTISPECIES: DUF3108 domain-containing protein [Elizabethkingia]|uniref:DUF3108 domain-containing protein n=1 Tax=Elizabethkingia TaxID=308865 RepID=UPI00209F9670|nr:hypothetical protein [Elizabethkingia sp. S0634]MCP1251648.1 hypothetical protein [Elizabethkingia sp. S0634]
MKSVRFLIPAILLLLTASGFKAQEKTQSPKHNDVNSALIKNEETEMNWYAVKDTTKIEIGKVITKIARTPNAVNITTTVKMKGAPSDWTDETSAKLPNLAPVKHSSFNMQRDMVLNFGKEITGYYLDKATNKKTEINEKNQEDFFDSNIYPQLIRWLPLKENYKTDIAIYDYNPKKSGVLKVNIQSTEKGMYKNTPVWIVKTTDGITDHKAVTSFYIDIKTRQLLKQEMDMGPRKMLMERVK